MSPFARLQAHTDTADNRDPCLDVKDGRVYDGAKLQIWECHQKGHPDFKNQQFNIEVLGPEDFLRR